VAGLFLGVIFFGGLWWTVSKGMASPRPALWFIGSLVLRTGIVLAGLYVIAGGAWQRMLMCLLGFVVARFIVTWLAPPPIASPRVRTAEAHHAP
jgi:F1F0 ATPase subunit 2